MQHTGVAMHLILALSVIILHHVDSYSCRSILKKLDDHHLKAVEDSAESYELKNSEVMELLQPFMKPGQTETPKNPQLHKNFAKLTIEPYVERNQTHQWQRNPYSRFNKRKTIAPLAIILTHLPDLKLKQAQDNMQKKNYAIDNNNNIKSENDNLHLNSRLTTQKTQYHPISLNKNYQNSEKLQSNNVNEDDKIGSVVASNEQKPHESNLDNSETFKSKISEMSKQVNKESQDTILTENQKLRDLDSNKRDEDYTDLQSKINVITDEFIGRGSSIQNKRPLKAVESDKDGSILDDSTLNSTNLNYKYKSDSDDDKIQDILISVSPGERNSIAQNRESQELDEQHHDIKVEDKYNIKDSSESLFDKLIATKSSADNGGIISEINYTEPIIKETEELRSIEDVTENTLAYHQIPLDSLQKYIDLGIHEETRKEEGIETFQFPRHNNLRSYEDQTVSESNETLSKEHITENSHENHHKNLYRVEEDSSLEDKELEEEPFGQNAFISSPKHEIDQQQHNVLETDKELSNQYRTEDSLKDQDKHLHSSEVTHKGHKHWHQDIQDWEHDHHQNIYNLCFHFNR